MLFRFRFRFRYGRCACRCGNGRQTADARLYMQFLSLGRWEWELRATKKQPAARPRSRFATAPWHDKKPNKKKKKGHTRPHYEDYDTRARGAGLLATAAG